MSDSAPKVAVQVRLQYGKFVDPERGIDEDVVFLVIDTETEPPVTYALAADQARALGAALSSGGQAPG